MNFWTKAPLFRLLLPFVAGILVSIYSGLNVEWGHWVPIGLAVALLPLYLFVKSYGWRSVFGIATALLMFTGGFQLTTLHTERFDAAHFSNTAQQGDWMLVAVTDPLLEKARSYKTILEVHKLYHDSAWQDASGHIITYFQKDSLAEGIRLGDLLLVRSRWAVVSPPRNPGEFNYKQYLSFHNIYHQSYLTNSDWQYTEVNEANPVMEAAHDARSTLLSILRENGLGGNEMAVASALILGYKADLDKDLVRAYSSAGATHVLAVSGLHVGIIFLVLNSLLMFMERFKHGKAVKAVFLLVFIWAYAFLTGLSPSVMRASTMFSFIIIGGATGRNANIYNTLAASAIFLLCINPYLVMEVGFQLSYLAVIGIVLLQPPLYQLWEPKWSLLDKIWAISAVSIAAQIATFPLGLLYFHQFPNYFLVSNLLVIPLASVIIYTGILAFIFAPVPVVCGFIVLVLDWVVGALNWGVRFIESLPYSILEGISISIFESWMIYGFIVLVTLYFFSNERRYVFAAAGVIAIFLGMQTWENVEQEQQASFVVYNVRKTSAYDFISGRDHVFVADSSMIHDKNTMLFHVYHHWWERGLEEPELVEWGGSVQQANAVVQVEDCYSFHNKRIAVVSDWQPQDFSEKLAVDYLIVARAPKLKLADLLTGYAPKEIVIDSSNSVWKVNQWKEEAKELGITVHSVELDGAFVREV